jgi:hypothetical protein
MLIYMTELFSKVLKDILKYSTHSRSVLLTQYRAGDNIKKNYMGWAYSAYGGGERSVQGFGGET